MLKLVEFVLWNNCPNNCSFCYLKNSYQSTIDDMMSSISSVDDCIKSINKDSSVLLTGGEMFVNLTDEVYEKLLNLYKNIYSNNYIKIIYFNTNLIYDINKYLVKALDLANELGALEKLHFTTSDDFVGRFNDNSRKLFYKNIGLLREKYPNLNIIVNSILTKKFCEEILSGRYNILDYCNKYKVRVNVLPYINFNNIDEYVPEKNDVIKSLLILRKQNPEWFDGFVDIYTRPRDMVVYEYDHINNKLKDSTASFSKCKHPVNSLHCFKDGTCFGCLLQSLK